MQKFSAVALFCDDIREEKSGQITLIGIMPDNAIVSRAPGTFPKLGVYVRIHLDPNIDPGSITVTMRGPGKKLEEVSTLDPELVEKHRTDTLAENKPIAGFVASMVAINLPFEEPGTIEAIIKIGDEEFVAGILQVKLAPES